MQIIFESQAADGAQMRERSMQRVHFALRRWTAAMPQAKVQFSDFNGPRGGVDKRCQVERVAVRSVQPFAEPVWLGWQQ